ncbi:amino acid adenylation domain-containing protein [Streptomyces roseolilacinus]|uniref:amino acid adenylation domain-containing protein n=1 Tax=Streptomyces roseolilacinus TaxID=66904 RepID=UPI003802123E
MTTTAPAPAESQFPADASLDADERQAWRSFNDSATVRPDGTSLLDRLERTAARLPDRPAVQAVDGTYTYRELHSAAERTARLLAARGIRPGQTVAVAATRRRADYVALLAALKAGCRYLPLAPDSPASRLSFTLQDAGAVALLAAAEAVPGLADVGPHLAVRISLGDGPTRPPGWTAADAAPSPADAAPSGPLPDGARPAGPPPAERAEERDCYVIYTSGSTGTPKGVVTGEEALLNLVDWYVDRHGVLPHDRLCQTAPLTFDPSVQQIFPAWATGACLVAVPDQVLRDGDLLLDWLRDEHITHLDIVTPHWVHLLDTAGRRDQVALPALRWIVVGGETYFYHQTHRWHRVVDSPARLNTIYGPTEATVNATEFLVDPRLDNGQVPIGYPLPNYRAYVLDKHGALCPPYITGELHLAGVGLARGYCSEEATRRSFHHRTVTDGVTERLYRTGDLARLVEADGEWVLEFQGRTDDQVKISGYRVELEEVQAAVANVPGVVACAVALRTEPAKQIVCGYVAPGLPPADLRAELVERLPGYMVPHVLVPLAALPLTPNGKADRDAVLALVAEAGSGPDTGDAVLPEGPLETAVAAVWEQVLGVSGIRATDDFFERGGSSLLAFRAVALLRERGVTVRATDVLEARTVRALARRADTSGAPPGSGTGAAPATSADAGAGAPPRTGPDNGPVAKDGAAGPGDDRSTVRLPPDDHLLGERLGPPLALPPATELVLLKDPHAGGHALLDLDLPAGTPPENVRRAVEQVFQRHPLLRARLDTGGSRPLLREVRLERLALPVVGAPGGGGAVESGPPPADQADWVRPLLAARSTPGEGLPAAGALLCSGPARRLLLSIWHPLVDGTALRRVAAEIAADLGTSSGAAGPLPPLVPLSDHLEVLEGQARRMVTAAPHLAAFAEAERAAQLALAAAGSPPGTVAEVDLGQAPPALARTVPREWQPLLAAAAALAAHDRLGLPTVPLSVPRQWRAATGRSGSPDAVARLSDTVPLLIGTDGGAGAAARSARDEWALRAEGTQHWTAALLAHCPELAARWPGPRLAPAGSFLMVVESDTAAGDGNGAHEDPAGRKSPTAYDPQGSGAVQFTLGVRDSGLHLRLIGWDLQQSFLAALGERWLEAVRHLCAGRGAGTAAEDDREDGEV